MNYAKYKELYDTTKPIGGGKTNIRPIGKRRLDWGRIEMDGDVVCATLHNTQVVRYYTDGRVGVQCNGWQTISTAAFIDKHSPFLCYKRFNRLWIGHKNNCYPIPSKGELIFKKTESGDWVPVDDLKLFKKCIDRESIKKVRDKAKPFVEWAEAFLVMSDGWIMAETRNLIAKDFKWEAIKTALEGDSDSFLTALCALLGTSKSYSALYRVGVGANRQYKKETLRASINQYIKQNYEEVHKLVPIESVTCPQQNIYLRSEK